MSSDEHCALVKGVGYKGQRTHLSTHWGHLETHESRVVVPPHPHPRAPALGMTVPEQSSRFTSFLAKPWVYCSGQTLRHPVITDKEDMYVYCMHAECS